VDLLIARDVDDAGRDRLVLTGSIDLASKDSFLLAARAVLRDGATTLVADLAGITFMDSTGIG
jgi:anti-anti-sigma regulatory factor